MESFLKIIVAFFFFSPLSALGQNEQFIEWSPVKRLTWEDYLARPSSSSDAAAITSTALGVEYHLKNNTLSYTITCRFSKTHSWGRHKTEYILQHEQGHFDIAEIYARKLNKALKHYSFNVKTSPKEVPAMYQQIMKEEGQLQNQYDSETDFSRDKPQQAIWLEKIQRELDKLKEYAAYK